MASAENYAQWLIANEDKKGTDSFNTVAEAYKAARSQQIMSEKPEQPKVAAKNDFEPGIIVGAVLLISGAMKILVHWFRGSNSNNPPSFISIIWPYIFGIVFVCWAIAQFIAGYAGISSYAGTGWAITAVIVSLIFRFTLPITVGAFYGAFTVWGWPWYWALIFAVPGLILIIPSMLISTLDLLKGKS